MSTPQSINLSPSAAPILTLQLAGTQSSDMDDLAASFKDIESLVAKFESMVRECKQTLKEAEFAAMMQAEMAGIQKMIEQAFANFAGAIAQGVAQIAGGAAQIGIGMKSASQIKNVKGQIRSLHEEIDTLKDIKSKDSAETIQLGSEEIFNPVEPVVKTSNSSSPKAPKTHEEKIKDRDEKIDKAIYDREIEISDKTKESDAMSAKAMRDNTTAQAFGQIGNGLGSLMESAGKLAADVDGADKAKLDALVEEFRHELENISSAIEDLKADLQKALDGFGSVTQVEAQTMSRIDT